MLASVLINNFNYAKYLNSCIESVLNQTYSNVEVILYDDGSTDNSLEVAENYKGKIKIIAAENYGKTASSNQANAIYSAFLKSQGEVIFLLDSDDVFKAHKIATVMSYFDSPQTVMVQHQFDLIDSNGKLLETSFKPLFPTEDIRRFIKFTNRLEFLFMQTSALAFKRDFLEKVLPLGEDDYPLIWPDIRLSRQAAYYGRIMTLHEGLTQYRSHGSNDSSKLKDPLFFRNVQHQYYNWFNEQNFICKRLKPPLGRLSKLKFALQLFMLLFVSKNWKAKVNFVKHLIFEP